MTYVFLMYFIFLALLPLSLSGFATCQAAIVNKNLFLMTCLKKYRYKKIIFMVYFMNKILTFTL